MSVFSCTVLFVSISQVIGCEDRLRNDLYCVEWGVKLYSNQPGLSIYAYTCCEERRCISCVMVVWWWWCLEAVARLGSLRAGALPSGPGRDRLLRTAVLRHFQRQRKSAAHARAHHHSIPGNRAVRRPGAVACSPLCDVAVLAYTGLLLATCSHCHTG